MKTDKIRERRIDRGIVDFIVRYSILPITSQKVIHSILIDLKECGSTQYVKCEQKETRDHLIKLLNLQDFVFFDDIYPHLGAVA